MVLSLNLRELACVKITGFFQAFVPCIFMNVTPMHVQQTVREICFVLLCTQPIGNSSVFLGFFPPGQNTRSYASLPTEINNRKQSPACLSDFTVVSVRFSREILFKDGR